MGVTRGRRKHLDRPGRALRDRMLGNAGRLGCRTGHPMTVAAMEALDCLEGWLLSFGAAQMVRMPLEKVDVVRAAFPAKPESAFCLGDKARVFAVAAHAAIGQTRKYTGEAYIVHPTAVVELVSSVSHCEEMIAAAWLHDVVEDTHVTLDDIHSEFGYRVAALVRDLTDVSTLSHGNRVVRKEIDRSHTAAASADAKTIKLADLIDNTRSIVQHDPDFAKAYLVEKALLLEVLREGDPTLWAEADRMVKLGLSGVPITPSDGDLHGPLR